MRLTGTINGHQIWSRWFDGDASCLDWPLVRSSFVVVRDGNSTRIGNSLLLLVEMSGIAPLNHHFNSQTQTTSAAACSRPQPLAEAVTRWTQHTWVMYRLPGKKTHYQLFLRLKTWAKNPLNSIQCSEWIHNSKFNKASSNTIIYLIGRKCRKVTSFLPCIWSEEIPVHIAEKQ